MLLLLCPNTGPSWQAILEATQLKDDPSSSVRRVVVTGCMAQRYAGDLSEAIPEADLVVGFQSYDGLPRSIREALAATSSGAAPLSKRQRVQVQLRSLPCAVPLHTFELVLKVSVSDTGRRGREKETRYSVAWNALNCS